MRKVVAYFDNYMDNTLSSLSMHVMKSYWRWIYISSTKGAYNYNNNCIPVCALHLNLMFREIFYLQSNTSYSTMSLHYPQFRNIFHLCKEVCLECLDQYSVSGLHWPWTMKPSVELKGHYSLMLINTGKEHQTTVPWILYQRTCLSVFVSGQQEWDLHHQGSVP